MSDSGSDGFEVEHVGDVTVARFRGERPFDEPCVQALVQRLSELVAERGCKKVLLDFGGVEALSSATLGSLITLHRKLTAIGGLLSLCNLAPQVFGVFQLTKLDKVIPIEPFPGAEDESDPEDAAGGVTARLRPPKPSGGGNVSLPTPRPETDD
jgi:anti-anti-sigma factor